MTRELADAINRLAEAHQAEAAAVRSLVELREQEIAETREARQRADQDAVIRLARDDEAKAALDGFRADMQEIAPALRMLVAIARTMQEGPR